MPHITTAVAEAWREACGKDVIASGNFAQGLLDDLCFRQGPEAVLAAIAKERATFFRIPAPQQLATAIRNNLEPLRSGKPKSEDAAKDDERHRRGVEATKRRAHDIGFHSDDPDPGCPACREIAA